MTATTPEVSPLLEIPVGSIGRDPDQPRTRFPVAEIEALAESLKAEGILQPITVTPNRRPDVAAPYLVLFGERRLLAACRAGFETVPCIVEADDLSPSDRLLRQIVENDQRAPLCLLDRAAGYVRAYDLSGLTDAEFCRRINISLSLLSRFRWVIRRQGLIREALDEDLIAHLETARLFDRLPAVRQLRLLREARKTGERITLKYVRRMIAAAEAEESDRDLAPPEEDSADPASPGGSADPARRGSSAGSGAAALPETTPTRPVGTLSRTAVGRIRDAAALEEEAEASAAGDLPARPAATSSRISIELVRDTAAMEKAEAAAFGVLPAHALAAGPDPDPPLLLRMTVEALDALLRRLGLDPHGEPGDRVRMLHELLEVNL